MTFLIDRGEKMRCFAGAKIPRLLSVFVLLLLAAACQPAGSAPSPVPAAAQPYPAARPGPVSAVALRAGDILELKFAYAPQFNQIETVRPDGRIELQLVGEVAVEGKTPAGLRNELMRLYADQLQHPDLAVIVKGFYTRRVFVSGQVKSPGPVPMPGEMTAMEAVMGAGGFIRETAEPKNVIVVRNIDGRLVGRAVDLKKAVSGEWTAPFYLQPRDVVYVPTTCIVDVDLWVQQHIWQILPPVGLGATMN